MEIKQHPASSCPLSAVTMVSHGPQPGGWEGVQWSRFPHHGVSSWDCSYSPSTNTTPPSTHWKFALFLLDNATWNLIHMESNWPLQHTGFLTHYFYPILPIHPLPHTHKIFFSNMDMLHLEIYTRKSWVYILFFYLIKTEETFQSVFLNSQCSVHKFSTKNKREF